MLVSIEGIIAARKSTTLKEIQRLRPQWFIQLEPFEQNPILPDFYADPKRYACLTQMVFFRLRVRQFWSLRFLPGVKFIERSIYADRFTFGEMLYEDGYMTENEWTAYRADFEMFSTSFNLKPDAAIFLDLPPELALESIRERGREMEKGIDIHYLTRLREKHLEHWKKLGRTVATIEDDGTLDTTTKAKAIIKGIEEQLKR